VTRMIASDISVRLVDGEDDLKVLPGSSLTLDEAWSPYIQGSIVLADLPSTLLSSSSNTEFRVRLKTRVGDVLQHASDLSAMFAGGTAADVSAAWQGLTGADISATPGRNWNADALLDPTGIDLHLYGESARQNDDGTWTVTVESVEARLFEQIMTADVTLTAGTVSDLVAQIGYTAIGEWVPIPDVYKEGAVPAGLDSAAPEALVVPYLAGDKPWEALDGILKWSNLRMMPGAIVDADWTASGEITLRDDLNIISGQLSEDRSQWARRILVLFDRTRTLAGRPAYIYDGLAPGEVGTPATEKTLPVQLDIGSPFPAGTTIAPDFVRPIRMRAVARSRSLQIEAVADYRATPRRPLDIHLDFETDYTARVQSVTFNLDDATMTLSCMDVTELIL